MTWKSMLEGPPSAGWSKGEPHGDQCEEMALCACQRSVKTDSSDRQGENVAAGLTGLTKLA